MVSMDAPSDRLASYPHQSGKPLDVKGLLEVFARRWRLFVSVVLGVVATAVIASLILRPVYEASAGIRVDPVQRSSIDLEAVARGTPPDQALVDSEVKIIQSRDVARGVVRELRLTEDPEFNPKLRHGGATGAPAEEITTDAVLKHLDVAREGSTYIIALGFKSHNPAKSANIANAFAEQYIEASIREKVQAAAQQAAMLNDRVSALGAEAQKADAALAQYQASNGITTAEGGTVTEQQISTLTSELANAESAAAAARSNYEAARTQVAQSGIDSVSTVINSPTMVELHRQHAELLRNQAEINARYGPKHPETVKISQQVSLIDQQMHEEAQRIVSGLASDARAAEARVSALRGELGALKGQLDANSRASVMAEGLKRDADAKHTVYNQVAASAQQASQQEHGNQSQAQIVARASVPTKAAFPNKALFAALGSAMGLVLGVAAVAGAEILDSGVRTPDEVERDLGLNFIAAAPLLTPKTLQQNGQTLAPWDYVTAKPMSGYAEAMRATRSAIVLSDIDRRQKVVLITSAVPNEGKTVTSVSLARVMAMSGERVVLVDCDLRRNALEGLMPEQPKAGLIEVLTGAATLDEVLIPDSVEGLHILPLHQAAFTPRDLFGAAGMRRLLDDLRQRYDHVILDGPPVLAVADARTLGTLADAVLMAARWNKTPRRSIQAAIARLTHDGARVAGVLLSMVDTRSRFSTGVGDQSYYYVNYRGYYRD